MNKQTKLFFSILILSLFLISFVSAGVSDAGVEYDGELIGQFLLSEWVPVTIDIKDTTNINIPRKDSSDFESKINQRKVIMINLTNSVLSTLSGEEFQLKRNSEFGGFFSGNITKEGFDKLLKDGRVKKIYAKKYGYENLYESILFVSKNIFIYFIPVILLILIIIILIKLKKKK